MFYKINTKNYNKTIILKTITIITKMKYILFILFIVLFAIKEFIVSFGKITYANHRNWAINAYTLGKLFLGWKLDYTKLQITCNHTLLISNHVNFLDAFLINYILAIQYPEYHVVYITREQFSPIPIVGNYLKNNHILVKYNFAEDKIHIEEQITKLKKKYKKLIIVLFPEGVLQSSDNKVKSLKWIMKHNLPNYNNVLAPRTNGIYTVLNSFNPEEIIKSVIKYPDNPQKDKGNEYRHLLTSNFPKQCKIEFSKVNQKFILNDKLGFEKQFYDFWKKEVDYE